MAGLNSAGLGLRAATGGTTGVSAMLSRLRGRGVSCFVGMTETLPAGRGGMGELCMCGPGRRILVAAVAWGVAVEWF